MKLELILFGCIGGALPDLVRLVKNRHSGKFPVYLSTANFWIGFILAILLGGFSALLANTQNYKEALAYGFSAPELITRLLSTKSSDEMRTSRDRTLIESLDKIRAWWGK